MGISLGDGAGLVGIDESSSLKQIPFSGISSPEFAIGAVLEDGVTNTLQTVVWDGENSFMPATMQPKSDAFSAATDRDPVMMVFKASLGGSSNALYAKVIANTSDLDGIFAASHSFSGPLPQSAEYISFSLKAGTSISAIRVGTTLASVTTVSDRFRSHRRIFVCCSLLSSL